MSLNFNNSDLPVNFSKPELPLKSCDTKKRVRDKIQDYTVWKFDETVYTVLFVVAIRVINK